MRGENYLPYIPSNITVHLAGAEEAAESVTLPFPEYIKTVASLTLDPNMPKEALYAALYAQISKALYRVTEREYRKSGYGFDITNDPEIDFRYYYEGAVFDTVSIAVDNIFNEYIANDYGFWPIDAEICYEGTRCRGLSVDGSIAMAENGRTTEEILEYYFGRETGIVKNAPVGGLQNSFLFTYPMYGGQRGSEVSGLQIALNRISANYTTIPYIKEANGFFGEDTVQAVKEFQKIFDLEITGIVEKDTYYKLLYVLDGIYKLNYLVLQSRQFEFTPTELMGELRYGDVGSQVKLLQYYMLFVSSFEPRIPWLEIVGVYGEKTYMAVTAFQRLFGFEPDGIVTKEVWDALKAVYKSLYEKLPESAFSDTAVPYGGNILLRGSVGAEVVYLQKYLRKVAEVYERFPKVTQNGVFDGETEEAVIFFQQLFGIKASGMVTSNTWNILSEVYNAIVAGEEYER